MSYLWDFWRDGDSEEVHGHVHASHHEDKQAVTRVSMGAQALLEKGQGGHVHNLFKSTIKFLSR